MAKKLAGYSCANDRKLRRVDEYLLKQGITDISEELILALYDKLGGEIKKGENIVKMGSFYDFVKKQPRQEEDKDGKLKFTKDVKFVYRIGEEVHYIDEGKAVPTEIKLKKEHLDNKRKQSIKKAK